ncbi:YncE family protein [Bacillus carboniphilus]|uniref:YncE family protein n=1 Tax=Bacillus carboniphilus TaxID=86663 RepID=A0ABY9JSV8_9BACI|nr:YncE family protein [Bacillus carboniphilus]WLR42476.1 YncE family protein [Bacillus carboniphilus]
MSILYTTGPIDNTNLFLSNIEIRVRNTDPSNSASVSVRLLDESSSPEALIHSNSFTVDASRTESELYSVAALSSFLIEVEIDLANRSEVITATAIQPTVTVFNGSSEFNQFIRLMVSRPELLQDIDYPITPQLNIFLPDIINCEGQISGDVSFNGVPQAGVDVSFTSTTSGVSFVPNPATTDMSGNYVTSVAVPNPTTEIAITGSATVDGQNVQSVGITEVVCFLLYVTNFESNDVSVIDAITNMVVNTITGINTPTGVATNSVTNLVYVASDVFFMLSVIDASTNLITNTIPAGINVEQFGVAVNENENLIYLANNGGAANTVTIVDGTSNVIIDTVTVPSAAKGVAVDQQRNLTYVTSEFSGIVSVIDGDNGFVITATVTVGGSPRDLAVNESTNKIYVTGTGGPSNNLVSVISGGSFVVTATISVGNSPVGIALNEENNLIYVTNQGPNYVAVIDGNLDVVTATISVGEFPTAITLIEDSNVIYVINQFDNNVSVIDGDTNIVTSTITVGGSPRDITFL